MTQESIEVWPMSGDPQGFSWPAEAQEYVSFYEFRWTGAQGRRVRRIQSRRAAESLVYILRSLTKCAIVIEGKTSFLNQ